MNSYRDQLVEFVGAFACVTVVGFTFMYFLHVCFSTPYKDPYKQQKEDCKSKCLPKPYDPKYIPEQCVCMEGEAK